MDVGNEGEYDDVNLLKAMSLRTTGTVSNDYDEVEYITVDPPPPPSLEFSTDLRWEVKRDGGWFEYPSEVGTLIEGEYQSNIKLKVDPAMNIAIGSGRLVDLTSYHETDDGGQVLGSVRRNESITALDASLKVRIYRNVRSGLGIRVGAASKLAKAPLEPLAGCYVTGVSLATHKDLILTGMKIKRIDGIDFAESDPKSVAKYLKDKSVVVLELETTAFSERIQKQDALKNTKNYAYAGDVPEGNKRRADTAHPRPAGKRDASTIGSKASQAMVKGEMARLMDLVEHYKDEIEKLKQQLVAEKEETLKWKTLCRQQDELLEMMKEKKTNTDQQATGKVELWHSLAKSDCDEYDKLWRDTARGATRLSAGVARALFIGSDLDSNALAKIWSLSDVDRPYGQLSYSEFMVACKLIAIAQEDGTKSLPTVVDANIMRKETGLPQFNDNTEC